MLNKAILIGNLGADPTTNTTQAGDLVANFNVATTEKWKGKDGQQHDNTEWHRIVVWRKLAEICERYLRKGSKVYIEGKIQTRKWTDNDGVERYATEINAHEMKMLGGKSDETVISPSGPQTVGTGDDVPF